MTAAVVRGGATAAERAALERKLAAAQGTRAPRVAAPRREDTRAARPGDAGYRRPNLLSRPRAELPAPAPRAQRQPAPRRAPSPARATRYPRLLRPAGSAVQTGAGFLLGLMFWGWIAMPFVEGGMPAVRNTLRAKFVNKAPDGSWLP